MGKRLVLVIAVVLVALMLVTVYVLVANPPEEAKRPTKTRAQAMPDDAVKMTPATDQHPPVLHSSLWEDPVPLAGPINTAGGEDSPFVLPDGSSFYFFFTPDVSKPANEQLFDDVSGIWRSDWNGTTWSEPVRVWLQDIGKLALDGAEFIQGHEMWFASTREGYSDVELFTADLVSGEWTDWQYAGDLLNQQYEAGEMHITADGDRMYFGSTRAGGHEGYDIWYTDRVGGAWQAPVNVEAVNTDGNESQPFVSQDGTELWFTRTYLGTPAIFRSIWNGSAWGVPELIVSTFAGEPTLDAEGNLYFVHHFYVGSTMVEADIYVAYAK